MKHLRARLQTIYQHWQNLGKRQRLLLVFTTVISVGLVFGLAHAAQAIDPSQLENPNWWTGLASRFLLYIAQFCVRIALFFLAFIIQLAGYNGYLRADTVQIGWVMVRDITNMFFVVLLLMIAFGTILGIEQYEWKKLIVKFVFAALLVNFSRIICGLFIDVSQLVMNTFVNGIAATAGGNFINMFSFDSIFKFNGTLQGSQLTDPGIFTASLAALIFAGEAMVVFGIFVFMLAARLVRLWILIVLSPLAFALNVVPLTQKFAGQWWTEFGDDLVTGPVLLFFIWLSFVSLSGGDVNSKIAAASNIPDQIKIKDSQTQAEIAASSGGPQSTPEFQSAGIGAGLQWNRMANFAIAIGLLLAGAKVASTIGGSSGNALSAVGGFAKKVATIGTGYAAGRWMYEKGAGAVKAVALSPLALAKTIAWRAPLVGGEKWAMRAKTEWEAWKGQYYGAGAGLTVKGKETQSKIDSKEGELAHKEEELSRISPDDTEKRKKVEDERNAIEEEIKSLEQVRNTQTSGGIYGVMGILARSGIATEKRYEKTKRMGEARKKLVWKRTGSEAGGHLWGMGGVFGERTRDAQDREERGELQSEEARSAAKDKRYEGLGKRNALRKARFKDGHFEEENGSMAEVISRWNVMAETEEKGASTLGNEARFKLVLEAKKALDEGKTGHSATDPIALQLAHMSVEEHESKTAVTEGESLLQSNVQNHLTEESQEKYGKHLKGLEQYLEQQNFLKTKEATAGKDIAVFKGEKEKERLDLNEENRKITERLKEIRIAIEQSEDKKPTAAQVDELDKLAKQGDANDKKIQEASDQLKYVDKLPELEAKWGGKPVLAKPEFEGDLTFRAARATAEASWSKDTLQRAKTSLESLAENEYIFKSRGAIMPNRALDEFIEKQKKNTRDLEYHQTVQNASGNATAMMAKREKFLRTGKAEDNVTLEETAISTALLDRAKDKSWVDDVLQEIWDKPELREKIAKRLGWTDAAATREKVGQVQTLMASGWDVDFVVNQQKMNYKMGKERKTHDTNYVLEHAQDIGKGALGADWEAHQEKLQRYGSAMQKLGSFKDEVLAKGHLENGGHTQFSKSLGIYIPVPEEMAKEAVYSDYNKQSLQARSNVHSHTVGDYVNKWGILQKIHGDQYRMAHGQNNRGLDLRNLHERSGNNYLGYASSETIKTDENNFIRFGGTGLDQMVKAAFLNAENQENKSLDEQAQYLLDNDVQLKEFKKQFEAFNLLIPQLQGGMQNFMLNAASRNSALKDNVDTHARNGTINLHTESGSFENVDKLIGTLNDLSQKMVNGEKGTETFRAYVAKETRQKLHVSTGLDGAALEVKVEEELAKIFNADALNVKARRTPKERAYDLSELLSKGKRFDQFLKLDGTVKGEADVLAQVMELAKEQANQEDFIKVLNLDRIEDLDDQYYKQLADFIMQYDKDFNPKKPGR